MNIKNIFAYRNALAVLICFLVGAPLLAQKAKNKAEPATGATPKTLLWKIEGNGIKTPSYLYATVHVRDDIAYSLTDSAMNAFEKADHFAMEVNLDSIDPMQAFSMMQLEGNTTLDEVLTDSQYQALDSFMQHKFGTGVDAMKRMMPGFIALYIQAGSEQAIDQEKDRYLLDFFLYRLAKNRNKGLHGMEQVQDQLGLIVGLPLNEQIDQLMASLNDKGDKAASKADLMEAYAIADLDRLYQIVRYENGAGEDFFNKFIVQRNIKMAANLDILIRSSAGSVFAAMGAGHLAGKEGVIELLKQKGYKVSPVFSKKKLKPSVVESTLEED